MLKPQGFVGTGNRTCPETCAYGAARDAVSSDAYITAIWPWLDQLSALCPVCQERHGVYMIPHLNNDHLWTREAIADWAATIEPSETTDAGITPPTNAVAMTIDIPVPSLRVTA